MASTTLRLAQTAVKSPPLASRHATRLLADTELHPVVDIGPVPMLPGGFVVQVEEEFELVRSRGVDNDGNAVWTVERGAFGTTKATHIATATVTLVKPQIFSGTPPAPPADPDAGGGGSDWSLVDLGVIDVLDLLAGPVTLYTPVLNSLVMPVLFPDSFLTLDGGSGRIDVTQGGFLADGSLVPVAAPYKRIGEIEVTAGNSLAQVLANVQQEWAPGGAVAKLDVQRLALQTMPPADRPAAVLSGWATWLRSDDPLQAWYLPGGDGFPFAAAPAAWQANHVYAQYTTIHGPDDHFWAATTAGTSDASIPDFEANEDDEVADGTVTWTDEGAIPTQGSFHLQLLVAP